MESGGAAGRRDAEAELAATKQHLDVLVEEYGRANDALSTSNDELVSANEELQSLNEELETAKEEVQASNEELSTLNDELGGRNHELHRVNADVLNLLDAVEIPILMLDQERRIRRFTGRAASFMGLVPADVGRRIAEVRLPVQAPDLEPWISRSMEDATLVEAEVLDDAGRWHRLQIRPLRGADGHVDGSILSLVDIDELRNEVVMAEWARDYSRRIVEAVQVPLVVLDAGLRVLSANAAYYQLFREEAAGTEGHALFELAGGEWDTPALRQALGRVVEAGGNFAAVRVERLFPGAGHRATSVTGCAVPPPAGEPMILLAIEDVTERRRDDQLQAGSAGAVRGLRPAHVELDWRSLVREVLETVRPQAEERSVRLAEELEGDPLLCRGDPGHLRQVVANLLSNAVKFTPGGGRVKVRLEAIDGVTRLIVADSGRGMTSGFLPHAFERFSQEEIGTDQQPGLGVGLSIVEDLVRQHGGTVRAESPGRDLGSTFTVTLPRFPPTWGVTE